MLPLLCWRPTSKVVFACGEMSEWLKEHAWKVCIRLIPVSRVRIPLSPPVHSVKLAATCKQAGQAPVSGLRCPPYGGPVGPPATIVRKSRQVRKEATVADDSGAGVWLAGPPPFRAGARPVRMTCHRGLGTIGL